MWEELAHFDVLAGCKCVGCTCDITDQLSKKREEEKLHQFLMGLDDVYRTVRSNFLSTTPLPSVNRAYSLICQEERVQNISKAKELKTEAMSFVAQTKEKNIMCKHYNREGHDANGCF